MYLARNLKTSYGIHPSILLALSSYLPQLRPNVLRTEKVFRNGARAESNGGGSAESNGGRGAIEMNYTTVQNGSAGVVIDGTTYTHAANGIGATG